jgi:Pyruvate/2-oxoacid:ferredoxin oxidoreductase delta subunit
MALPVKSVCAAGWDDLIGGHEAELEPERIMQHLDYRRDAIGRAGRVGDDVVGVGVVRRLVHAHHDRGATITPPCWRRAAACPAATASAATTATACAPDNAVIKTGEDADAYLIDLDYCKGCGICVAECPAGAIQMVPEEI